MPNKITHIRNIQNKILITILFGYFINPVTIDIREIEKQIECEKEMKRWYLRKMFPDQ